MDHIMSGHSANGNRGPRKDKFPDWMTESIIKHALRTAYKNAHKAGSIQESWEKGAHMVKQLFEGTWNDFRIKFWFNYTTRTIETAWPVYGD